MESLGHLLILPLTVGDSVVRIEAPILCDEIHRPFQGVYDVGRSRRTYLIDPSCHQLFPLGNRGAWNGVNGNAPETSSSDRSRSDLRVPQNPPAPFIHLWGITLRLSRYPESPYCPRCTLGTPRQQTLRPAHKVSISNPVWIGPHEHLHIWYGRWELNPYVSY